MPNSLPVWRQTAKNLFTSIKEDKGTGIMDKVIIDCAFKEDLQLRKKYPEGHGGCNGFHPSLTTNGMCYTFNGKETSELWQSSEIFTTFANLFTLKHKSNNTFGGTGTVQGNIILKYNGVHKRIIIPVLCTKSLILSSLEDKNAMTF